MKSKMIVKLATDIIMTVALLLLMTYELIGQAVHEWIGVGMFVLFILHHLLNGHWSKSLLKGKYTAVRVLQTVLVALVLLSMLGSMFSGVILSRHVFSFISIRGWRSFARNLHMISAYWGFVFMALHLGFHWNMIMGMARKLARHESAFRTWTLRIIAALTEASNEIRKIEQLLSVTNPDSDIHAVNHSGGQPVMVSRETAEIVSFALQMAEETNGALEPTVYPVLTAW